MNLSKILDIVSQNVVEKVNETVEDHIGALSTYIIIGIIVINVFAILVYFVYYHNSKNHFILQRKERELQLHQASIQESEQKLLELETHIAKEKIETDLIRQQLEEKQQQLDDKQKQLNATELERNAVNMELDYQVEMLLNITQEVEQQKKNIEESILYASKIQRVLLPDDSIISELLNDYFVFYRPLNVVSGDFYYICSYGTKTIVIAADCTGHGVPGALMSVLGITSLNEILADRSLSSNKILDKLRRKIIMTLQQTTDFGSSKDGMDMACCVIDWDNGRIEYSGANIPLYLVKANPTEGEGLIELLPDKMPIGIHLGTMSPFRRQVVQVETGDSIYLMSDGYCDQIGGPKIKKYLKKNFRKFILDIHNLSMTEQHQRVRDNIDNWKGDLQEQIDDMLVIGFKI